MNNYGFGNGNNNFQAGDDVSNNYNNFNNNNMNNGYNMPQNGMMNQNAYPQNNFNGMPQNGYNPGPMMQGGYNNMPNNNPTAAYVPNSHSTGAFYREVQNPDGFAQAQSAYEYMIAQKSGAYNQAQNMQMPNQAPNQMQSQMPIDGSAFNGINPAFVNNNEVPTEEAPKKEKKKFSLFKKKDKMPYTITKVSGDKIYQETPDVSFLNHNKKPSAAKPKEEINPSKVAEIIGTLVFLAITFIIVMVVIKNFFLIQ